MYWSTVEHGYTGFKGTAIFSIVTKFTNLIETCRVLSRPGPHNNCNFVANKFGSAAAKWEVTSATKLMVMSSTWAWKILIMCSAWQVFQICHHKISSRISCQDKIQSYFVEIAKQSFEKKNKENQAEI